MSCRTGETSRSTARRWTSADLAVLPDNGKRYESIDGDLYISQQPHWHHQRACGKIATALDAWSRQIGAGEANIAPGVIFAEEDGVVPDVVWISQARRATALGPEGHLHAAPELLAYPADRRLPARAARPASRSDPVSYGYPHLFTPARVRVSGRNVVLRQCRGITPRYYSRF